MAKSRKPIDETKPTGSNGVLFINYDLSEEDKGRLRDWKKQQGEHLEDMLNNAIDAGYQVSLKKDTYNDCMGAFLIAKDTKTENDGYILTGRGNTAVGALFGLFYRHYAVFEGIWPVHNHRTNVLDDD